MEGGRAIFPPSAMPSSENGARRLARLAYEALLVEVRLTPKPGLVDRRNTGAHRDMTLATFEASAAAIAPFFRDFVKSGAGSSLQDAVAALPELRRIGLAAETAMLCATGGVNTHKGAIFCFGMALGAAGRLLARGAVTEPEPLCREVAAISAGIVENDLAGVRRTARTAGEYIYRRYGLSGARGEVESGFALVQRCGLPAYRATRGRGGSEEIGLLAALVALLAENSDTNLIARGGLEGRAFVRREAQAIHAAGPFATDFHARTEALDDALIARNLSPGGTADLLGLTWFLANLSPVAVRP